MSSPIIKNGTVLENRYQIIKVLAQGGMGIVYLVLDQRLQQQFAMKEVVKYSGLPIDGTDTSIAHQIKILRKLNHPMMPRVTDVFVINMKLYIVMEYINGITLAKYLEERGHIDEEMTISWGQNICQVLAYLHSQEPPIIYRDMKPENLILGDDKYLYLVDFGIAKEYFIKPHSPCMSWGSKTYAAPEQYGDNTGIERYNTDVRTDIYNLGATLLHLVYGSTDRAILQQSKCGQNVPQVSVQFRRVLGKCLAKNPEDRFQNCDKLSKALLKCSLHNSKQTDKISGGQIRFCLLVMIAILIGGYNILSGIKAEQNQLDIGLLLNNQKLIQQTNNTDGNSMFMEANISNLEIYHQIQADYHKQEYVNEGIVKKSESSNLVDYINQNCHTKQERNELMQQVAFMYLYEFNDLQASIKYFQMLDQRQYPIAEHYLRIITYQSELQTQNNIDSLVNQAQMSGQNLKRLLESLSEVEVYTDYNSAGATLGEGLCNIKTYLLLINIYLEEEQLKSQCGTAVVRLCEKGIMLIDLTKEEFNTVIWKREFEAKQVLVSHLEN